MAWPSCRLPWADTVRKTPELIASSSTRLSPWVILNEKTYRFDWHVEPQTFHSLRPQDYVNVLAITADGRIPLVRQFRPALNRYTLELPGGLLEAGETPANRAMLELEEETGFRATKEPIALPPLCPDTGRLENALHGFILLDVADPPADWQPENEVERLVFSGEQLCRALLSGELDHAPHVSIIGLALLKGLLHLAV
jgi:ADP-ribose pyrophosphatase